LLYTFLKYFVGTGMKIFCRKIIINKPALTGIKGPVMLASNHPNSFLDAIILDVLFDQPIHSLARGDAFVHPIINNILRSVKILPVYRTSEGVENLSHNYKTFASCVEIFRKNGLVLIFSEGLCENEWKLRPLKKGTARLAIQSWQENIPLRILPIALNYSSFRRFGKNIYINFGDIIEKDDLPEGLSEGQKVQQFNAILKKELESGVFVIEDTDRQRMASLLEEKPSQFENVLLAIPAALGWLLHWPLYTTIVTAIAPKYKNTVHYDSILIVLLLLSYPFYLTGCTLIAYAILSTWQVLWLFLFFPFTAWAFTRLKPQLDHPGATAANVFH
jgi:1-acyl-sn-glycerol-3-phosphate acyltransferase